MTSWGRQNPDQLNRGLPLGNFSQWAEWVRDPLIALGACDAVDRVEAAKANDAHAQISIFEVWAEQFKDGEKTSKDAYDNEKVRVAIEGGEPLTRQKFASRLSSLIGVRLGGYVMESPNKAEKGPIASCRPKGARSQAWTPPKTGRFGATSSEEENLDEYRLYRNSGTANNPSRLPGRHRKMATYAHF